MEVSRVYALETRVCALGTRVCALETRVCAREKVVKVSMGAMPVTPVRVRLGMGVTPGRVEEGVAPGRVGVEVEVTTVRVGRAA
jgi:hypothetical protein